MRVVAESLLDEEWPRRVTKKNLGPLGGREPEQACDDHPIKRHRGAQSAGAQACKRGVMFCSGHGTSMGAALNRCSPCHTDGFDMNQGLSFKRIDKRLFTLS